MINMVVADDEMIERTVVSRLISKHFKDTISVYEAVNGREAIEFFNSNNCKIALLDISMPGINGLEAAEKIREQDKECVIIFLTAFDEFDFAKRAIAVSAMEYMLKPASNEEIIAVIDEAVRTVEERNALNQLMADDGAATQVASDATHMSKMVKGRMANVQDGRVSSAGLSEIEANIKEYIDNNYMNDISLQTVASFFNYSDAYFCKMFKQSFGKGFVLYLCDYRIEKAKKLMESPSVNIREISEMVGYKDPNYFTKVFKKSTSMTPSEYRSMVLKENING